MAKLTTEERKNLPDSAFGLPKERRYPMPDKSHAVDAKARAKRQLDMKNITPAEYRQIVRKANEVIARES